MQECHRQSDKHPDARIPTCRCTHWYTAASCTKPILKPLSHSKAPYVAAWNGKVGQQPHWEQQIHTSLHSSYSAPRPCKQSFPWARQTILTHLLNVTSFLYIQHSLNQSSKQHMDENLSCQLANKGCEVPIIGTNSCNYRFSLLNTCR